MIIGSPSGNVNGGVNWRAAANGGDNIVESDTGRCGGSCDDSGGNRTSVTMVEAVTMAVLVVTVKKMLVVVLNFWWKLTAMTMLDSGKGSSCN